MESNGETFEQFVARMTAKELRPELEKLTHPLDRKPRLKRFDDRRFVAAFLRDAYAQGETVLKAAVTEVITAYLRR